MSTEQITRELEQLINSSPQLARLFPRSPAYSYWESPSGRLLFCYNTEPLSPSEHTKNKQWSAWVMSGGKKNGWRRTKTLYFAKRKTAKARALLWLRASQRRPAQ